jgi:hypothetical protein
MSSTLSRVNCGSKKPAGNGEGLRDLSALGRPVGSAARYEG